MLCTLLARCRFKLHDQFGGYPAAILHFNALGPGPLAYLGGVQPARRSPARAARLLPRSAADPPGSTCVAGQGVPQLLGMPGVQVDLYSVPSRPKRMVPSAALPSRSSMNRVCIF